MSKQKHTHTLTNIYIDGSRQSKTHYLAYRTQEREDVELL